MIKAFLGICCLCQTSLHHRTLSFCVLKNCQASRIANCPGLLPFHTTLSWELQLGLKFCGIPRSQPYELNRVCSWPQPILSNNFCKHASLPKPIVRFVQHRLPKSPKLGIYNLEATHSTYGLLVLGWMLQSFLTWNESGLIEPIWICFRYVTKKKKKLSLLPSLGNNF